MENNNIVSERKPIAYCLYRVSTVGQVDKVKDDIPMQKQVCHEFAERQGWIIGKEFYEKGVSGFKVSAANRDAIQELRAAAERKETKINLELKKNTNQLERLQEEIANTLTGDSVYTSEQLSSAIKTVEDRISTQKFQLEQLQNEATSKKAAVEQIRPMFEQFVGWSQEFDNCTIEQKRMIISQLVNRIELNKDYEITIELNMDYKDFCDDWDTLNTASTVVA